MKRVRVSSLMKHTHFESTFIISVEVTQVAVQDFGLYTELVSVKDGRHAHLWLHRDSLWVLTESPKSSSCVLGVLYSDMTAPLQVINCFHSSRFSRSVSFIIFIEGFDIFCQLSTSGTVGNFAAILPPSALKQKETFDVQLLIFIFSLCANKRLCVLS